VIAVDTSALVSVAFAEPDASRILATMTDSVCIVGAPTAFEARMVVLARGSRDALAALDEVLAGPNLRIVPFGIEHVDLAHAAFARYGRGTGHPARLNFGDCMTYAVAKRDDLPLLFKGDDFVHTDLRAALPTP
jgi:ribonuclease VapC